jgi:site-specific DNA recombinase
MKTVRCAIYTRKSSEEGLEQDFNSLDAQREACAAYILSQASEGWKAVPDLYDDGGLSGGSLERPALRRLLADIKLGRIDIIVVYKVDRLTRSLLDFAKLVEAFDAASVSFVSVTQSFNTTTSMGRLTLNMLLSFAQFEREVTAERIRDKIAASKARGMWMGGLPPLGYRPNGRSLTIVEEHAGLVRQIYRRYLELGTVRLLSDALNNEAVRAPERTTEKGFAYGGGRFSRGQLYSILKNPIYAGKISHKGKVWDGNHPALIEEAVWGRVQEQLAKNTQGHRTVRERSASLLAGKIFDPNNVPLITVHTTKGQQRYRYYVRRPDSATPAGSPEPTPMRIPANELEQVVTKAIARELNDPLTLAGRCGIVIRPEGLAALTSNAAPLSERLAKDRTAVRSLLVRAAVHPAHIDLELSPTGFAELLGLSAPEVPSPSVSLHVPVRLTHARKVGRLIERNGTAAIAKQDPALVRHLLRARQCWQELAKGEIDVTTLAKQVGVNPSYLTRLVRLNFLAPTVVDAILSGVIREEVGSRALIATDAIPASWRLQEERYLPS